MLPYIAYMDPMGYACFRIDPMISANKNTFFYITCESMTMTS